jgi:hypothetical protein
MDLRLLKLLAVFVAVFVLVARSSGRLAPKVAIAPLVFLATRKPVIIAWAIGTIGMLALVITSAQANGKDPYDNLPLLVGLSLFCGGGVAPLTVGPVFLFLRARTPAPVLELEPGERLVEALSAGHFLGGESRGGKLHVTDRRLVFVPGRFNVQLDPWSVRLEDVTGVRTEGTRMVLVATKDGAEAWLVAMSPRDVAAKIEAGLERPRAVS